MNLPEIAESANEVTRFHFRAFHIVPLRDGVFVQSACHAIASPELHESGNDLHVKNPARQKWCAEYFANGIADTEQLGTALRVVDRETEARGDECGADAANVVARRPTADFAAEEADARSEDDVDLRAASHDLHETGKLGERRGQVGVPESHEFGRAIERREDSATHSFSLSAVFFEVDDPRAGGRQD